MYKEITFLLKKIISVQLKGIVSNKDPDPGPRTQVPGPGTQDSSLRTKNFKIWYPRTLNYFIELQNKRLKSKKSLKSKRDNTKYPFTYFSLMKIIGFFFSS